MKKFISVILSVVMLLSLLLVADVSVSAATVFEYEVNNTYGSANSLTLGNTMSAIITDGDDVDYFKLVPSSNGKISISFKHTYMNSGDDWSVEVYKQTNGEYIKLSENYISLDDNENISLPYIGATKNSTYYVVVNSNWSSDVYGRNYYISTSFQSSEYYEKEINDTYSQANNITLNKTYSGNICNNEDSDYYRIKPTSNGKIAVYFKHKYKDSYESWKVTLYRYSGGAYNELSSSSINLNDNESVRLPYIGAVKDGIYFIKVEDDYSHVEGENYNITTKFTKTNAYEREINDIYANATKINVGGKYTGNANRSADDDYYKFIAPVSGRINIKFGHIFRDVWNGWDITLYRYSGGAYNELFTKGVYLRDDRFVSLPSTGIQKGGVYYIKVHSGYDVVGDEYTISSSMTLTGVSSISAKGSKKSVKVSWKCSAKPTSYQLQMKKGSRFVNVKTTKSKSYTKKSLKRRTKYTFRVRYKKKVSGKYYYSAWRTICVKTR